MAIDKDRRDRKSKLLVLVPCLLIVIGVLLWIYLFVGSHR
jgi:hypothetical protein